MTDQQEAIAGNPESGDEDIVVGVAEDGADKADAAPVLERREAGDKNSLKRAIFNVPIEVVVSVGTARPLIGDLLTMGRNHLLPLDSAIDDPVELRVKEQVIARGELAQVDDGSGQLGVRVTEVVNISGLTDS